VIKTFRAKNYGCLKDVTATLTPLHAFIGPNDSGKSTLLHGMRTLVQLASGGFHMESGAPKPFDPFIPVRVAVTVGNVVVGEPSPHGSMLAGGVDGGWYAYEVSRAVPREQVSKEPPEDPPDPSTPVIARIPASPSSQMSVDPAVIKNQLRTARLVRFDPDALRAGRGLIPEIAPVNFLDDRGHGLGGVYFAIRNRDDGSFAAITEDVRRRFPTIQSFRVKAVSSSQVILEAHLVTGERVDVHRMSEGLLYYLAFAALRYLDPVSLLLVEEPENGLHPARIGEVVRILRIIVEEQGTQVVMATHSPLVINEMQPEEVSIVTRTEAEGTRITPIRDTTNFAKRSSVYALGELWLSFADGVDEAPLIHGHTAP
jgi:predicted ATPase